jgi:peptidoglycan hydrolase CwlO-like protein
MTDQNLLDRLESAKRRIVKLEAENNKLTNDCKSKNGYIASLRKRNSSLRSDLAKLADVTPNGHDKIEAWRAIAEDCKHLD